MQQQQPYYMNGGRMGEGGGDGASGVNMRARNTTPTMQMKRGYGESGDVTNAAAAASLVTSTVGHQRMVAFEGLEVNGKITMNGNGSDAHKFRVDETAARSSGGGMHLNNPFATNYATAQTAAPTRTDVYSQISAVLKKNTSLKSSGSNNELNIYGGPSVMSHDGLVHPRPQRPHSIAVSATMGLEERKQPLSLSTGTKMSHSTSLHQTFGSHAITSDGGHIFKPIVAYGHYGSGSPSRMSNSRSAQEFAMYSTPNAMPSNGLPTIIPPVVQRRSQSTPRPVHGALTAANSANVATSSVPPNGLPQRPRSLDRSTLAVSLGMNLMEKKAKPPPIPSRRFSQPLGGQTPLSQANATPQRMPPQTNGGMRQSVTFHGQMNRHAAGGGSFGAYDAKGAAPEVGPRRKQERPVSFAYGTMPEQDYLENQLKMYSEQLKTITETVRKYSEQAKLLSELKRQQAQQQLYQPKRSFDTLPRKLSIDGIDGSGTAATSIPAESQSHQMKLFLDTSRSNAHDLSNHSSSTLADRSRTLPRRGADSPARGPAKSNGEAKTPSDQLRQFLDAIRSNQLPEENADDLSIAANRFSKFKENLEKSRPKSLGDFEKFEASSAISETFNQVSDNLRIMNQDLEALGRSPMRKQQQPPNAQSHPSDIQITNTMDFNQILDRFTQLTNNAHALETVDYLRKCSEALRQTSEQLRLGGLQNSFSDSNDSSSSSTTPCSIREAVQNLMQQPRNGVLIMDDRMKLFIDILDSQSKFSQVCNLVD